MKKLYHHVICLFHILRYVVVGLQHSGEELRSAPLRSRVQSLVGSEFRPGLKKLSCLSSFSKHRLRPGPAMARCVALTWLSRGLRRPLCKGGEGFNSFLDLHEKTFLLN
jgi:hypothetical protein